MKKLWELFITFFKIGAVTFGGGYAMLSIIQKEVADKKKWATNEEVLDCFAVSQCTPGVISVNTATHIGYRQNGIKGAFFATLGVITPSVIIICIIAALLTNFADNVYVQHAMGGIRVIVCIFICNAVVQFWKSGVKDYICVLIFLFALLTSTLLSLSSIIVVILAILAGVTVQSLREKKKEAKH